MLGVLLTIISIAWVIGFFVAIYAFGNALERGFKEKDYSQVKGPVIVLVIICALFIPLNKLGDMGKPADTKSQNTMQRQ